MSVNIAQSMKREARVTYRAGEVKYQREFFASAPAQVMVLRLTADQPGKISFSTTMSRSERATVRNDGKELLLEGQLHNGTDGNGVRFLARLGIQAEGGTAIAEDGKITVGNANAVTLFISVGTDFQSSDFANIANQRLSAAIGKPYAILLQEHITDYQSFYNRVQLSLPSTANSALPVPERLAGFAAGTEDPALAALY